MDSKFSILEGEEKMVDRDFVNEGYDYIVRGPCAAFIFGEHSVMYGNAALYHPIPFYVYVGLKEVEKSNSFFIFDKFRFLSRADFDVTKVSSWDKTNSIDSYMTGYKEGSDFRHGNLINQIFDNVLAMDGIKNSLIELLKELKGKISLSIKFAFYVPLSCGLDSSGGFAGALATALALYTEFVDEEEVKQWRNIGRFGHGGNTEKFDQVYKVAWMIECAFHNHASSGAGALAGLIGGDDFRLPFVFQTEERSFLSKGKETPIYPVRFLSEKNGYQDYEILLDHIKYVGIRGRELITDIGNPPEYYMCLIYSGKESYTADVLERIRRYFVSISSKDYVLKLSTEDFVKEFKEVGVDDQPMAIQERTFTDLGRISRCGINYFFNNQMDLCISSINAYQELLVALDVSSLNIERIRSVFSTMQIGTKLTGCGEGGDVLILGDNSVKDSLEKSLRQMREFDFAHNVHYASWLMKEAVNPVTVLKGGTK